MSEWLGTGLQNRLHQFESGWNLRGKVIYTMTFFHIRRLPWAMQSATLHEICEPRYFRLF